MVSKIPRKLRNKGSFGVYVKKADEYLKSMKDCKAKQMYDSAALSAIHSVISTIDAMLIYKGGIVSASIRHEDAITLLKELWDGKDVSENAAHALKVIVLKAAVEYTDYLVSEKQVEILSKHAERFVAWSKTKLP